MATIANLLVRLGADFGDAPQKVQDLHDGMDDLGHSADDAGHRIDDLGHHAHESGEGFEELREHLLEAGKELIKMGAEALELTGIFETLKESLEISAEVESVEVAITQLAGSVDKASDMIDKMEALSKAEALRFPEVEPAAQHFMALGFSAEQTVPAIAAAGNASWALGMSLESVTQRMGMMVMGGMVSGRYLRSIGVSLEDLAATMGITGDNAADLERKVREAFKFEDEEDRLNTLVVAMQKFSDMGGKEADTLTGHWIEMKNAWHEAFKSMGDDLNGLAKQLTTVGTQAAEAVQYMAANSLVDLRNNLRDLGLLHSKYEDKTKVTTKASVDNTSGNPDQAKTAADKAAASAAEKQARATASARIATEEATQKSLLKMQLDYYKAQAASARLGASELIAIEKSNNFAVMQVTLTAIAQKKALQDKSPEGEEKDATLDTQASAARNRYAEQNAELDNKELERQHKFVEETVKTGEQRVIKEHDLQDKMQSQLEAFVLEQDGEWRKLIEGENKAAFSDAEAKNKSEAAGRQTTNAGLGQSIKSSQMALERSYGLEYTHTLAQQVAYQRQLGELAAQQLDIKAREASAVADASKKLADMASANATGVVDEELKRKAIEASTKAQDDALKSQEAQNAAANARYETETKIADLIKQQSITGQLAAQFVSAGQALPGNIGGGIASGIFHQGKGGMDIGKQITDALRNVGKNLLGDVITAAIKELVIKTGLQTAATNLMTLLFPHFMAAQSAASTANTAALTALSTAVVANTAAVTASAATSGAGAAVGSGGAAAGAVANVAASATPVNAAASIIGPVIGGVISGVISAVATFIGDASIVGAINKTTAAVYSLRTSGVASSSPTGAPGAAGGQPAQTPPASSGFFANMASSLLDAFTAADAIPVKIMAINPGIVFASVSSMFGFASGGPVPYDMVAQVHAGEHVLNADQVAGLAPLPDLPAFSQYGGVSRDQGTAISSQSSNASNVSMSGPMHFHGVQNVRQLMKEISEVSKNASPSHSPLGR